MSEPLVYALTVNWNRAADTLECLDSLACQTYPNLRLLVIDNGSTDDSVQVLRSRFPQVELVANPRNLGFAGGYNLGLRLALQGGAEQVFIINNDAYLDKQAISALMQQAAPRTGILAPLAYYASQPGTIWSAGGRTSQWTLERSDEWARRADPGTWPEQIERDFLTGCGMLLSRQALEQVGLFDELFHMYYEDSDLCYRMRQAGFRLALVPGAKLWHKVAVSSGGSDSPAERYWMARSSVRYFRKHARGLQIPAVLFWRTGSALRTTWRLARAGRWSALRSYWTGLFHGLVGKST